MIQPTFIISPPAIRRRVTAFKALFTAFTWRGVAQLLDAAQTRPC
jgi:hypothetical protein